MTAPPHPAAAPALRLEVVRLHQCLRHFGDVVVGDAVHFRKRGKRNRRIPASRRGDQEA